MPVMRNSNYFNQLIFIKILIKAFAKKPVQQNSVILNTISMLIY